MCTSSFVIGIVMGTICGALLALITITLLMVAMENRMERMSFRTAYSSFKSGRRPSRSED